MQKLMFTLMAMASLLMINYAKADLGWTKSEARSAYGAPIKSGTEDDGRTWLDFKSSGYYVSLWFLNGHVSRAAYTRLDQKSFGEPEVKALIAGNVPVGTEWGKVYTDAKENAHRDSTDQDDPYHCMLMANEKVVAIWDNDDNSLVNKN
jgi:hypothetical protein